MTNHGLAIPMFALLFLAAGCAGVGETYRPIIDGEPTPDYERDLADCRVLARQRPDVDQDAVLDTAGRAAVGGVWGGVVGAAATSVSSAIGNRRQVAHDRQRIIRRCMIERGHKILD